MDAPTYSLDNEKNKITTTKKTKYCLERNREFKERR